MGYPFKYVFSLECNFVALHWLNMCFFAAEEKSKHATPIYSLDVHPDGTRFATGGGDQHVKIWSTSEVEKYADTKQSVNEENATSSEQKKSNGFQSNAYNQGLKSQNRL